MIVYTDLDGTMLGRGGSLLHTAAGELTMDPVNAIADLHRANVPLVLVSGRTRAQLVQDAGLVAADGFICELGALVSWDHGRCTELLAGDAPPPLTRCPDDVLEQLLERYDGVLDLYDPWHIGHEVDILLRGRGADAAEVEAWLASIGYGWLRMRDNGVLPEAAAGAKLRGEGSVHVFHLMPGGISKGKALAWDLQRRGIDPADAIACGDSASDLTMAPYVGRFFLMANGARHPHMAPLIEQHDNITVTEGWCGAGFAEAVQSLLATAR